MGRAGAGQSHESNSVGGRARGGGPRGHSGCCQTGAFLFFLRCAHCSLDRGDREEGGGGGVLLLLRFGAAAHSARSVTENIKSVRRGAIVVRGAAERTAFPRKPVPVQPGRSRAARLDQLDNPN